MKAACLRYARCCESARLCSSALLMRLRVSVVSSSFFQKKKLYFTKIAALSRCHPLLTDVAEMQVIDCVRQKIHEKQLQKEIATAQKQITMVRNEMESSLVSSLLFMSDF